MLTDHLLHEALHLQNGVLVELRELLVHAHCAMHRQGMVSGHAEADCEACSRHDRARRAWQRENERLMLAVLVSADEFSDSGCTGDSEIMAIVHRVAEAAGLDLQI
jgi:hypothetical protein